MKEFKSHYLSADMKPINIRIDTNLVNQPGVPEPDICPVKFVEGKNYGQIIKIHNSNCHNKND